MSSNELLLDVEVFPDYGQIDVSDLAGYANPEWFPDWSWSADGIVTYSDHTVYVHTMSVETAIDLDRDVRVRVYRGIDPAELGTLVFDRELIFTDPPRLAIYQPLAEEDPEGSVPMERTGPVRVQIYLEPPDEADQVNVLIRYDL